MLRELLSSRLSQPIRSMESIGGGSINETFLVQTTQSHLFCKTNDAHKFPGLFRLEAAGLEALRKENIFAIPEVIDQFESNGKQVLLLEWIGRGIPTPTFWKNFGRQLSELHQVTHTQFGWKEDNYMGAVPQSNGFMDEWSGFFTKRRIRPLLQACLQKNLLTADDGDGIEKICQLIPSLFEKEAPSLLHGDLWSGNFMCNHKGSAVLIDPAVYYGHRSVDLAMTTLFGGFNAAFYDAYQYYFPFTTDFRDQWAVCQLYPLLIHLLLFGSSYRKQIIEIIRRFE